ncbi:hypothetical protein QG37_07259 [Candidozyma auris]|uniref:Uncharacterized protein n=1 Tax=Candidozyma auris TaxID=498019 RepID=A0A0L0NRR6_CANAR|nr:hypothetical protein QG37_07259 [[Candida] auris]
MITAFVANHKLAAKRSKEGTKHRGLHKHRLQLTILEIHLYWEQKSTWFKSV